MIKIENLVKKYNSVEVLKNISIQINNGESVGIVGPNGVGKTTLIESICGLTQIESGEICLDGISVLKAPYTNRHEIGCCFQESVFDRFFNINDTLIHTAMYHGMTLNKAKQESSVILKRLQLYNKRNCYGSTLSGGMKKRFQLAVALVNHPSVLILDEPTAGVDLGLVDEIYQIINDFRKVKDRIVILTSHNINELAALCTRLIFLKDGIVYKEYFPEKQDELFLEAEYRRIYLNEKRK